jgi:hypothetical protein
LFQSSRLAHISLQLAVSVPVCSVSQANEKEMWGKKKIEREKRSSSDPLLQLRRIDCDCRSLSFGILSSFVQTGGKMQLVLGNFRKKPHQLFIAAKRKKKKKGKCALMGKEEKERK